MDIRGLLGQKDFREIYNKAHNKTKEIFGNVVQIRAILEFSNFCSRECIYCGLNCKNKNISRYRMNEEEIIDTAILTSQAGYQTIVLQSGEDGCFSAQIMGEIIKEIKKNVDISITLSIGELTYEAYQHLKDCGADRYLLKHETADENIYRSLHPNSDFNNRINCLKNIKKLGYETGSGFMIGLPNQTHQTIEKDILLLQELQCDMAGIGPFIPHNDTRLKNEEHGSTELTKRAVALTRLLIPTINLPATTSLGVLDGKEKEAIFYCGANVIMRKVTPEKYRDLYDIYPRYSVKIKSIKEERIELEQELSEIGVEYE